MTGTTPISAGTQTSLPVINGYCLVDELDLLRVRLLEAAAMIERAVFGVKSFCVDNEAVNPNPIRPVETKNNEAQTMEDFDVATEHPTASAKIEAFRESSVDTGGMSSFSSGRSIRKGTVVGRGAQDSRLTNATDVAEYFVSNVAKTASIAEILDFLNSKTSVLGLARLSHENARSMSLLLTVPLEEDATVTDPYFWPPGIHCRRFVRPKTGRLADFGLRRHF
jgi:hypothetical protein